MVKLWAVMLQNTKLRLREVSHTSQPLKNVPDSLCECRNLSCSKSNGHCRNQLFMEPYLRGGAQISMLTIVQKPNNCKYHLHRILAQRIKFPHLTFYSIGKHKENCKLRRL